MNNYEKRLSWFNTPQGEKASFWGLIGLTFFIIIIAFFSFRSNLRSSFTDWQKDLIEKSQEDSEMVVSDEELIGLQNKDTDQDGLTDFEELYIYKTSPYLVDSDSDGKSDQEEITTGENPNCAPGQDCGVVNENTNNNQPIENINNLDTFSTSDLESQELRELLLQAGVPQDVLNQTDDQTLFEVYQETIEETGGLDLEVLNQTQVENSDQQSMLDYFEKMSASELRSLMISEGFDPEVLDSMDDETLKATVLESLRQEAN
ncbi:MAG: hypothetical protein PHS07_02300 [Patescibacteria group bacterium]|nr:hypothetical protein [Patescibacteria group bacterium]